MPALSEAEVALAKKNVRTDGRTDGWTYRRTYRTEFGAVVLKIIQELAFTWSRVLSNNGSKGMMTRPIKSSPRRS